MKFTVKGQTYEVPDPEELTTLELREIKKQTGMGLRSFTDAAQDLDGDATVGLVWVAKTRAGEKVQWSDFDDLRPFKDVVFEPVVDEDVDAEGGPNRPNGSSPSGTDAGMFPLDESAGT